jgi:creatinine amidohydrolase
MRRHRGIAVRSAGTAVGVALAVAVAQPVAAARAAEGRGAAPVIREKGQKGVRLEDLTWVEAERVLTSRSIVAIPLGAAAKEHGPHLKLKNDWLIADYLARRVIAGSRVVMAPTIPYHFYPAFVDYPGSTTLSLATARDLVIDICRGLARFGPRRFYVINTGVSTVRALEPAAHVLAGEGILMRYTVGREILEPVERLVREQAGGTHADEIETSMMLYMNPESVDMSRAVRDYDAGGVGPLTRRRGGPGTYSPTGIWGDPTLASRAKGERIVEALVAGIISEIEELRRARLPPRAAGPGR